MRFFSGCQKAIKGVLYIHTFYPSNMVKLAINAYVDSLHPDDRAGFCAQIDARDQVIELLGAEIKRMGGDPEWAINEWIRQHGSRV